MFFFNKKNNKEKLDSEEFFLAVYGIWISKNGMYKVVVEVLNVLWLEKLSDRFWVVLECFGVLVSPLLLLGYGQMIWDGMGVFWVIG